MNNTNTYLYAGGLGPTGGRGTTGGFDGRGFGETIGCDESCSRYFAVPNVFEASTLGSWGGRGFLSFGSRGGVWVYNQINEY